MKKLLVSLFAVALCVSLDAAQAATKSVVEYYNDIPASFFNDSKYELKASGKKWVTASTADAELEPVVDIPNGYIRIEDPGTGGGTRIDEIALFVSKAGAVVIGINHADIDGVTGTSSSLLFVAKEGNRWIDVTKKVMPQLTSAAFFNPGFDPGDKVTIQSWYELPRKGTTVIWNLDAAGIEARIGYEQNVAENRAALANIKAKKIELRYDAKTGTFSVGR
jgi:hypothetical protein